ncbi:MAG: hypothetical protein HY654_09530 [Acidobacteria bacterium]|nr:hypothetical protein [Acidobacteriota bacterium]
MGLRVLSAALALAFMATAAGGQTLAEIAKKEEERRKNIKQPAKVITNNDLRPSRAGERPPVRPAAAAPAEVKPVAQPAQPAADSATAQAKPAEANATEKKDEAYWRDRLTAVRTALDRNRVYLDAMQSRINALTTDFVNRDDPAQRAVIASDRQRALAELDRLKQEIVEQTKEIDKIHEEARRAGVPPGWLRQ